MIINSIYGKPIRAYIERENKIVIFIKKTCLYSKKKITSVEYGLLYFLQKVY